MVYRKTYVFQNPQEKFLKKWDKSYFILLKIYMKTNQVFKNIPVATSHKFTQLTKKNEKLRKEKRVKHALAGNRTRASRVAGENSTTEPPVLCMVNPIII